MTPEIQLIKSLVLTDFPSGSSINYREGKFYLIGDDACHILILDGNYEKVESVQLFNSSEKRIPKSEKPDLEGSVILKIDGNDHLLIIGSASRKNRKYIILIPFSDNGLDFQTLEHALYKTKKFIKRISSDHIEEINLEGACLMQSKLVLGNRGNRANQNNHLIITDKDFWKRQEECMIIVIKLLLSKQTDTALGISELCYIDLLDTLLITLTSEATDNAYDDGEIGNSYIAWINAARTKLHFKEISVDGMMDLGEVDAVFKNEKIEGICAESVTADELLLHMVSDNDKGESRLFKVKLFL